MKTYLVGGAVRDFLLGYPVKEKDYVVVGATPQEMIEKGFQPVGKDFPVFLHPQTHEEYALARTERKTGKGYKGFEFHTSPDVTLEEDLKRRDLTINAIAQTTDGTIIDPYGGQQDLKNKLFKHVSAAFEEDPVRILRVARLAARFPDFQVHPETNKLMQNMVKSGEVDALVAERVWQEFQRALQENHPKRFFEVLKKCSALPVIFPEITVNQKIMNALKNAVTLSNKGTVRFAALLHDATEVDIETLCQRLAAPREYRDLAILVARYKNIYNQSLEANEEDLLTLLEGADAFRRSERFLDFLLSCQVYESEGQQKTIFLQTCLNTAKEVSAPSVIAKLHQETAKISGETIAKKLREERIKAITKITNHQSQ